MMEVLVNGEYKIAKMGLVKEIRETSIVFDVENEEVEIEVDLATLGDVKETNELEEMVLFPIDIETESILFNAEPIESV